METRSSSETTAVSLIRDRCQADGGLVAERTDAAGREGGARPTVPTDRRDVVMGHCPPPSSEREQRLIALADRLDRTLAHQLVVLAPLAWHGDDAHLAIQRLQACRLKLAVAAAGLRAAVAAHGRDDHLGRSDGVTR